MAKKSKKTDDKRISTREWEESLYSTGAKKRTAEDKPKDGTSYYTFIGHQDSMDASGYPILIYSPVYKREEWEKAKHEWILAKKVCTNGRTTYFVKIDQNGELFNPIGMYTHKNDRIFQKKKDLERQKLVAVKKDIFYFYLRFLSTKNKAWLSQAKQAI